MLYINKQHVHELGICWNDIVNVIRKTVHILRDEDVAQPIKPYLRYHNLANRIIAMPAYVGGEVSMSGIKWIASFPENSKKGLLRAHSVTILNDADTGVPLCVFNTALISGIRTAGVSALMLQEYLKNRPGTKSFRIGIVGFGPIGQLHLHMLSSLMNDRIGEVRLYDLKGIDETRIPSTVASGVKICSSWQEAYAGSDIFITCTVSKEAYIDLEPEAGSLHLNISLRDYTPAFRNWAQAIIVDNWEEVCRENTDIENMNKAMKLQKHDAYTIVDAICGGVLPALKPADVIMFNPMGLAIFDIATAAYYYQLAIEKHTGILLDD